MNLAFKFPIVYWNCACLINESGSFELEEEGKNASRDYTKLAKAIGNIRSAGVQVSLADINSSSLSFKPDAEHNRILFGLKGLSRLGDEIIKKIIAGRPYSSIKDFYYRIKPTKPQMLSLIKGGAFDNFMERKAAMAWYIWEICDKKSNLTLQNMPSLIKYNLIPQEEPYILGLRIYNFNRYLKLNKLNNGDYKADTRIIDFLAEIGNEDCLNGDTVDAKNWEKQYKKYMDVFRNWLSQNKAELLFQLNSKIFKECWDDNAKGTYSTWEMEVMCFYYHDHELAGLNQAKYGYSDFFKMPVNPPIDRSFSKGGKTINLYKLSKICGTCIAKDKDKSTISLLTPQGVVPVKFNKEFFAMYDKRISEIGSDGKKHIVEYSWFDRGNLLVINGVRIEDTFICKKYSSTVGHRLTKITSIDKDGNITLQGERYKGGIYEEET